MDKVNETLLLSLKQEVKTLNEIIKNFPVLNDNDEEIRSWLFPSKSHHIVNELICTEAIFMSDNFKTYLELIIDRLYVGIRLILNWVEEKTGKKQKRNRYIHRPKLITLGSTFQRLWQSVSEVCCNVSFSQVDEITMVHNSTGKSFTKGSQTDITALNKCDSCSSAILCMRNLLKSFEKKDFINPMNERQILRPKIYDITQFGSMLQTTTVVEKGVNVLYEKLFCLEKEKESLQHENERLNFDDIKKRDTIAFLQNEVDILKDKGEKGALKITILSKEKEELMQIKVQQDFKIKTLGEVISNLNNSIKSYNEKIVKVVGENEKLSFFCKKVMEKQLTIAKVATSIQSRLFVIDDEHLLMKDGLVRLEKIMDRLNGRLDKTTKVLCVVRKRIEEISGGDLCTVSVLESKLQNIKKTLQETLNLHKEEDSKSLKQNPFEMKGNPVEDLSRQIEENTASIKKLENENIKLKNIISKLQCIKK